MYAANLVPTEQVITEQLPTQQSPCTYPHGSIPCKVWNHTYLDCTFRELDCIPPLPHASSLRLLDLSNNKISHILDDALSNLCELQSLDLSRNDFSIFHFQQKKRYKRYGTWICVATLFHIYMMEHSATLPSYSALTCPGILYQRYTMIPSVGSTSFNDWPFQITLYPLLEAMHLAISVDSNILTFQEIHF